MKLTEVIRDIDSLSVMYREERYSTNNPDKESDAEIIKKLAYGSIIEYAITNGFFIKGFDFERYKTDIDYIWYDELIQILSDADGMNCNERGKIISSDLSFFFGYLRYRLIYAEFSFSLQ